MNISETTPNIGASFLYVSGFFCNLWVKKDFIESYARKYKNSLFAY